MMASRFIAAACHTSSITLSAQKSTQKCVSLIHQAARHSADLVVFPESYIPAFPVWSAILAPTMNHHFFERMAKESILIDGEEMRDIRDAAKQTGTVVSIGFSEKVRYSTATLFNSNLIIGADGEVLVHHRKLMPTFFEKLTWSPGDGHGLRIAETKLGKIGALICGENTNPLARYALMAQGEQIHISTWPAVWPTSVPNGPRRSESQPEKAKEDSKKRTNYDNVAANRTRAAAHCFENKCFGILCTGHLSDSNIETLTSESSDPSHVAEVLRVSSRGATMFLDPTGATLPGFVIGFETGERLEKEFLQMDEDILYAEIDLDKCIEGKQYHDVVGGYQRLDVFDLKVDRTRREPATFTDHSKDIVRRWLNGYCLPDPPAPHLFDTGIDNQMITGTNMKPFIGNVDSKGSLNEGLERQSCMGLDPKEFFIRHPPRPHELNTFITPDSHLFQTIHLGGAIVDLDKYFITIDGLVKQPFSITLPELKALPSTTVTAFHECYGSPLKPPTENVWRIGNVTWTGVLLRELLAFAQPFTSAQFIWSEGLDFGTFAGVQADRYQKDLPLSKALTPEVILAYGMNGEPLSRNRGGPVRLIVPGWYGTNMTKWLCRISLQDHRAPGPFTTKFYNEVNPRDPTGKKRPVWEVEPNSMIVSPVPGSRVRASSWGVEVVGWAWSSDGVDSVEIGIDDERRWVSADVESRSQYSWQQFRTTIQLEPGEHQLSARARSKSGLQQPLSGRRNHVDTVKFEVSSA